MDYTAPPPSSERPPTFGIESSVFNGLSKTLATLLDRFVVEDFAELMKRDYRLESVLGSGGFGVVLRASNNAREKFAVKFIFPDHFRTQDSDFRVWREIRHLQAISHENVVKYYSSGKITTNLGDLIYLVMEYIEGTPLHQWIERRGNLVSALEVIDVGIGVANGLAAIHGPKFLMRHRDIKPSNIMVCSAPGTLSACGDIKIVDFGLVKSQTDSEQTPAVGKVGTELYAPPEYLDNAHEDTYRWDLFSLGCVLYQMVMGELPFSTFANKLMDRHGPSPSETCPGCHPELSALIMKLISHNPQERPGSARAVAEELIAIKAKLLADHPFSSLISRSLSLGCCPTVEGKLASRIVGLTLYSSKIELGLLILHQQEIFLDRFASSLRELLDKMNKTGKIAPVDVEQSRNLLMKQYRDFMAAVDIVHFSQEQSTPTGLRRFQKYLQETATPWYQRLKTKLNPPKKSVPQKLRARVEDVLSELPKTAPQFRKVRHLLEKAQLKVRLNLAKELGVLQQLPTPGVACPIAIPPTPRQFDPYGPTEIMLRKSDKKSRLWDRLYAGLRAIRQIFSG